MWPARRETLQNTTGNIGGEGLCISVLKKCSEYIGRAAIREALLRDCESHNLTHVTGGSNEATQYSLAVRRLRRLAVIVGLIGGACAIAGPLVSALLAEFSGIHVRLTVIGFSLVAVAWACWIAGIRVEVGEIARRVPLENDGSSDA